MTRLEIERELRELPEWHYEIDLGGVKTKIRLPSHLNRHRQRKKYFFDPLVRAGAFQGKRVLDLGCNAGFWALSAIEAGAAYVFGIDARPHHIAQASLVFRAREIARERYDFAQRNVFDPEPLPGNFDVVLCLGLLYHVCKPVELFERVSQVNSDLLVIDTSIMRGDDNLIELREDPLDDPRMSADYTLVFYPTRRAVMRMVGAVGYSCVALRPEFDDWEGCEDFRDGDRLAFACAKRTELGDVYSSLLERT